MPSQKLTTWIFIAMLLGIVVGYMCNQFLPDPPTAIAVAGYVSLLTDIFLRLIKMIIGPLVFSTLVVGIAHLGDTSSVGRVGLKAITWFLCASLTSLLLGIAMVNLLHPGVGLNFPLPATHAATTLQSGGITLKEFVAHLVPKSIAEAMANNEILQIVVFSIFFGLAAAHLGDRAKTIVAAIDDLTRIMLRITAAVMSFAPVAVFAAMASIITTQGLGILLTYGKFMAGFYVSLLVLWVVLALVGFLFLGRRVFWLLNLIKEPVVLAFSTASSEAAYPKTMEQLSKFGVNSKITSFVLPLGYSFNLDGSMMYCTFAVLFIAQAYGIELSLGQQVTMLLILMVTSKGMAGVPRASLVVIAATLATFNIPEAGLLLIMGVDQFLDMGRSATNVIGNSLATAVVAKWEGELEPFGGIDEDAPAAVRAASA